MFRVIGLFCLTGLLAAGCGTAASGVESESMDPGTPEVMLEPEQMGAPEGAEHDMSGTPTVEMNDESTPSEDSMEVGRTSQMLLDRTVDWLSGTFDSSEQAARDPQFFAIRLDVCPVEAPELGERVLYVEQATMAQTDAPYRQRLYVIEGVDSLKVTSRIFTMSDEASAIGLCRRAEPETFSATEAQEKVGCAVELNWNGTDLQGGTVGTDCASSLRGASYATSQVSVHADRMLSWDQGFDATGNQVWGAVSGPYEFIRQVPTEPIPETDPDPVDGASSAGERCDDAGDLLEASEVINEDGGLYTHRVSGRFGASNDYNPLDTSGLAPGCSIVYDAFGMDVVYRVRLAPGSTFQARLTLDRDVAGALYFLDSCENPGWPDIDESGACGRGEYRSHGSCSFRPCDPLEWSFTWPYAMNGEQTGVQDLFLVIDQVAGNGAESYLLEWSIVEEP